VIASLQRMYAIAINTFREAVRDRVLHGVLGLASAVLLFTLALAQLSLDQEERVVTDIGLASISFFSVVVAVFLGSSLLYKEIERKTLYVILPKSVHRWEFLVGKYAGIVLTAFVFVAIMGAIQVFVMAAQAGIGAGMLWLCVLVSAAALPLAMRFAPDPTAVIVPWSLATLGVASVCATSAGVDLEPAGIMLLLNVGEIVVLTAVALLFGSFSTPFLTGGLSLGLWMVGRRADVMASMRSQLLGEDMKALLRGIAEVVPNFNLFVPGTGTLESPEIWTYVATSLAYAVLYATILLGLAGVIFRRRDFL